MSTDKSSIDVVRAFIANALPDGNLSLAQVAQKLGISERTLQRRLARAEVSYSELVDNVRLQIAIRLLDDPTKKVADVATLLGYADAGSFTRAFERWTGVSPRLYRSRGGSAD